MRRPGYLRGVHKVDANQADIVRALRDLGASVTSLAKVGDGCPDLLIGWRDETILAEVKDGARPPSERRLTEAEARWHRDWTGGRLVVVSSIEEALALLGVRAA